MSVADEKEFAEKWAKRLKGSIDEMRKGVERLNKNPAQEAIKKKDKMKAHLIEAIDNGVWEAQLGKVTLEEWKDKYLKKGLNRIASGADEAKGKMEDFGKELLTNISEAKKEIENMPDLTLEDNINRMVTFIRRMSKFKYKKPKK